MPASRRSWLKPRRLLAAAACALCLWIGWQLYRALTAVPGPQVDYGAKLHELATAMQPPTGEDAWPPLRSAAAKADQLIADRRAAAGPDEPVIDFTVLSHPDDYEKRLGVLVRERMQEDARKGLAELEAAGFFKDMELAARAPGSIGERRSGALTGAPGPGRQYGTSHLQIARIEAGRMQEAFQTRDHPTIARAYEEMLAAARALAWQGHLIDHLVAIAIVGLADSNLQRIAERRSMSADSLRECLAAMHRQPYPPAAFLIEAARLEGLDLIQSTHTDDGRGGGRLIPTAAAPHMVGNQSTLLYRLPDHPVSNVAGSLYAGRRATTRTAMSVFDQMRANAQSPLYERSASGDPFPEVRAIESLGYRFSILKSFLPLHAQIIAFLDRREVEREGLRTLLLVELYRMETHRYPDRLEQLVPAIVDRLPVDPLSGKPFGYHRIPQGDRHGRHYILYSVGFDGQDDGGRIDPNGNTRALQDVRSALRLSSWAPTPFSSPGFDYIVNAPPDPP